MATYIIGDVQGCFQELQNLLDHINFDESKDRLGFVGDLVNRGPDSLKVLRFIKSLKEPLLVLGNHDFYLLIIGYGLIAENTYEHTLQDVLNAPDKLELLEWLRHYPLIQHIPQYQTYMVHAGIPPQWDLKESVDRANEIADALQGSDYKNFLAHLFGNEPASWDAECNGLDRLRYITNALTRMRFCEANGTLNFSISGIHSPAPNLKPWFSFREPEADQAQIAFGHWAALNGQCNQSHCKALDTACVWGHRLTALKLDTHQRYSVPHAATLSTSKS